MCWYSASTLEHHTHKHIQDNLPIHPDDPAFYEQFSEDDTLPFTSKLASIPPSININERARAAKHFLEEGNEELTSPFQEMQTPMSPTTPKHHIKHGPIKSSKKIKAVQYKDGGEEVLVTYSSNCLNFSCSFTYSRVYSHYPNPLYININIFFTFITCMYIT